MLTWTHPQQAMKQNMNTLIGMGLSFGTVVLAAGVGAGLYLAGLSETMVGTVITLLLSVAAVLCIKRSLRIAEGTYSGSTEML